MTRNKTHAISINETCRTIINPPSPLVRDDGFFVWARED